MADCPSCEGAGVFSAFVDWHEGGRLVGELRHGIVCHMCGGQGGVSDVLRARYDRARVLRDRRVKLSKSLREASYDLGITPADLSKWEHGDCRDENLAQYETWLTTKEPTNG